MVKDYSASYVVNNSRNRKTARKKMTGSKSKDFFSATKLMWKTLGAMLLVTVVIGITSTIWYGWQVQLALDQIGKDRITNIELANENKLLIAQHDLMLTQEHMENAAGKIGLYTPSKAQLRYPK
jgi:uncharacterized protein HemX